MSGPLSLSNIDIAKRFEGQFVTEALRQTLVDDLELGALVIEGGDVSDCDMVWLDALRRSALPEVFWHTAAFDADFAVSDPATWSDRLVTILTLESKFVVTSRVRRRQNEDAFTPFRRRFAAVLSDRYDRFMGLLRSGALRVSGIPYNDFYSVDVEPDLWSTADFVIHLTANEIWVGGDTCRLRALRVMSTDAPVASTSPKRRRGPSSIQYPWETIARRFCASLRDIGWPDTHVQAAERIVTIMQDLGYDEPGGKSTIDNAMKERISSLWALFPSRVLPRDDRFRGLLDDD